MNDFAFALAHNICEAEAIAYRRGQEAHQRGSSLHTVALSPHDAWYAAGFHDADIEAGHSILEGSAS